MRIFVGITAFFACVGGFVILLDHGLPHWVRGVGIAMTFVGFYTAVICSRMTESGRPHE